MIYRCKHENCNLIFDRPFKLKCHNDLHMGMKYFKCDKENCCKCYSTLSHLKRHQKNSHNEVLKNKSKVTYVCSFQCGSVFSTAWGLKRHEIKHTSAYICKICKRFFQNTFVLERHTNHHKNTLLSKKCTKKRNYVEVQNYQHYQCSECKTFFKRSRNLKLHLKTVHSSTSTLFLCGELNCAKVFRYKRNLKVHIERTHLNTLFTCPIVDCLRTFKYNKSLKKHLKLHKNY
ncbi:hypothetical protein PGB90_002683 [Kerria lacca]